MTTTDRPRVLIEDWLPIAELGVESRRERAFAMDLPPLFGLHVWWARRPLVASAGVILASLMPSWSADLAALDDPRLRSEANYRRWFLRLVGIWGDPVTAQARKNRNQVDGIRSATNPFDYKPAFKNSPNLNDITLLHRILLMTWGELPAVLDPTAGGGTIPYEAARYGLPTTANDLNGVAAAILRATVQTPALYGIDLDGDLEKWGQKLVDRCRERLSPFFPSGATEKVTNYLFARTVTCPRTGKPVPLVPSWWLRQETGDEAAVQVVTEVDGQVLDEPRFVVLAGKDAVESRPDEGTVNRGAGTSIWDSLPIDPDYIKSEAQAGRMVSVLFAVAVRYPRLGSTRSKGLRGFREPTETDRDALAAAEVELARLLPGWRQSGVVPTEQIPDGNKTSEPIRYGLTTWLDLFSPRQVLTHGIFAEEYQRLLPELLVELGDERGRHVAGLLGLIQGKALNWDSALSSWNVRAQSMRSVFDRHDLAYKWTFAEFEAGEDLFVWALERGIRRAYGGIASLYQSGSDSYTIAQEVIRPTAINAPTLPGDVTIIRGNAGDLDPQIVPSGSQALICIDPPYYDNVMYAELSDFFGVWEQHTVGRVWPDLMPGGLADVVNEAVANPARFASVGRRKKELANADYQAKMQSIFAECLRALRDDGVLSVMFTHKRAEAWDTLGMALMEAGFEIVSSWPVNTEKESSLHQARMNAAASTVMLVCRKRAVTRAADVFFEDVIPDVKAAAREAAARFEKDGIQGVDLLLATYGPALSVISAVWPVYSSEASADGSARLLRPEEALDVARQELVEARRRSIVGRQVTFDPVTDFWLIAWELFKAEEFPYDDARRLALAVGGQDPDGLAAAGLLKKKAGTVVLQSPADRRRRVLRPVHDGDFENLPLIDVLHGVLVTADLDGLAAAKTLMDRYGLTTEPRFLALVQGAVNAVPRTKQKGVFIRSEAATLDALVTAYLPSVTVPEDELSDTLFDAD